MKSIEWLDKAKEAQNLKSDNALANALGIDRAVISQHRRKRSGVLNDETAYKIAELLDINPAVIMADQHAEGSKNKEIREIWQQIAKTVTGKYSQTIPIILGISLNMQPLSPLKPLLESIGNNLWCA